MMIKQGKDLMGCEGLTTCYEKIQVKVIFTPEHTVNIRRGNRGVTVLFI
jgi:hypothetical protein